MRLSRSTPNHRDPSPPARLCPPNVSQLSKTAPPAGILMFKHKNPRDSLHSCQSSDLLLMCMSIIHITSKTKRQNQCNYFHRELEINMSYHSFIFQIYPSFLSCQCPLSLSEVVFVFFFSYSGLQNYSCPSFLA